MLPYDFTLNISPYIINNYFLLEDIAGYSFRLVAMLSDYTWHTCPDFVNVCSIEMILTVRFVVAVQGHCTWHLCWVAVAEEYLQNDIRSGRHVQDGSLQFRVGLLCRSGHCYPSICIMALCQKPLCCA